MSIFDYLFSGVYSRLDLLLGKLNTMAATLDDLKTKLDQLGTILDNIAAIVVQLKANQNDPAKVQALSDELDAELQKAGAITA